MHGDDGLLMAPAFAVPRLLARNGLTLDDLDYVEIHEAFAATVLTTLAAWESRGVRARRGSGSTARSAPSTARGSTCTARRSPPGTRSPRPAGGSSRPISKELHRRKAASGAARPVRALVSVCAAGGLGLTAILEAA